MKKYSFLYLFFFVIFSFQSTATIITVDNNYPSIGNYTTLQAAHDAAINGDTLYVFPSQNSYDPITATKKLTIIGSGFGHGSNGTKETILTYNTNMAFEAGSANSVLEGFDGSFNVVINENNITIKRNAIHYIEILDDHNNTLITQNFICNTTNLVSPSLSVYIHSNNEVTFSNNILFTLHGTCIQTESSSTNILFLNNIFRSGYAGGYNGLPMLQLSNSTITMTNCILLFGYNMYLDGVNGNDISYCMSSGAQLPNQSGNILNQLPENIFVDYDNHDYHLKPDSPAIGTGLAGSDMGIYSGTTPYIDGGYPGIPAIYYLAVPLFGTQENGINITVKAKSNPN